MEPRHRVLRECIRHYLEFEALCTQSGNYSIEYGEITLNFLDLQDCLRKLSKRKKEAVYYNVILDWKQKDVAEIMGITTVSVGQYVEQSSIQIEKMLWPE